MAVLDGVHAGEWGSVVAAWRVTGCAGAASVREGGSRRSDMLNGPRILVIEDDPDLRDLLISTLTDALGNRGYAFVEVKPNITRNREDHTVDITFDVQEGPQVYVERIDVVGNVRTLDKVIRREFQLVEGDAFNTSKMQRSQQRLKNLGFFKKVEVTNSPGSAQGILFRRAAHPRATP